MSSTNKTANYELSQFVGTDIPSILSDYNGDMRKIDAGIAEVATSAGSSASAVSALAGRVTTAENSITSLNGALEVTNQRSIQNQTAITAVQGVIPSDASIENQLATKKDLGGVMPILESAEQAITNFNSLKDFFISFRNDVKDLCEELFGEITPINFIKTLKIMNVNFYYKNPTTSGKYYSLGYKCGDIYGNSNDVHLIFATSYSAGNASSVSNLFVTMESTFSLDWNSETMGNDITIQENDITIGSTTSFEHSELSYSVSSFSTNNLYATYNTIFVEK